MLNSLLLPTTLISAIAAFGLVSSIPELSNVGQKKGAATDEMQCGDDVPGDLIVEETLASPKSPFRCTIYYTPKESGFTADEGFDISPETRPGLGRRMFPREFLLAVQKEGYGRISEPVDGKRYISYCGGEWKFAEAPMDCRGKPLIAKRSSAVKTGHNLIRPETKFRISGSRVPQDFEDLRWVVSDTGSGLSDGQIDLYWGEDDPSGPGKGITFPKGSRATIEQATIIVLR